MSPKKQQQNQDQEEKQLLVQQHHHSYQSLTCCSYFQLLYAPILVCFFLGVSNSLVSGNFADLATDAFGNNSYAVTGAIGGGKGLVRFFYAPIFSSLSDIIGRRPVMITSLLATSFSFIVYSATGNFLACEITDGVFGLTVFLLRTLIPAVMSDLIVDPKIRTVGLAMLLSVYESSLFLSFVGDKIEFRVCYAISAIAVFCGAAVGYFLVPETNSTILHKNRQNHSIMNLGHHHHHDDDDLPQPKGGSNTNIHFVNYDEHDNINNYDGSPKNPKRNNNNNNANNDHDDENIYPQNDLDDSDIIVDEEEENKKKKSIWFNAKRSIEVLKKYKTLQLLSVVAAFNSFDQTVYSQPILIYLKDQLGFDKQAESTFLIIVACCSIFFSLVVAFAAKLLRKNKRILLVGLTGSFLLSTSLAFVKTDIQVFGVTLLIIPALAVIPTVGAIATQTVDESEMGAALGVIGAARVVASAGGPFIFGELFEVSKDQAFAGWPFLVGSAMLLIAFLVGTFLEVKNDDDDNDEDEEVVVDEIDE